MMINRMPYKSQSMNMVHRSRYGTQIWLGDYFAATNVSLLKQKDIKSVLTSAAMLGVQYTKDMQINHKTINAFDLPSYKMTPHFQEAFLFIDDALKKGNLLVHCAAGISRSTTCVLVYLMRMEGMTFKQGLDYIRSKRSIVNPNEGFQRELKRYELTLKKMQPKNQKEKVHEMMTRSDQMQQKKVVLQFIKDEKPEVKTHTKMNSTVNGYGRSNIGGSMAQKESRGAMRGQSLNYRKNNSNVLIENGNRNTKYGEKKDASKLTNQYLTFKLQNPKIVTIRK